MSEDASQVPPLYEREADAAPGPFYVVEGLCLLCSLPVDTAPANLTWSAKLLDRGPDYAPCPDHCRVERQPQSAQELTHVIEAAGGSCVQAIRYCGTDPEILARFRALGSTRLCDALVPRRA